MDDSDETQNNSDENSDFESCGADHHFCTVGLGTCQMRKGHGGWGQKHVCNKCGAEWS